MDTLATLHSTPAAWLRRSDLLPFVPAYRQYLTARGYAPKTCRTYLSCVAHFASWLTHQERPATQLCNDDVSLFLDEHLSHCTCPSPVRRGRHECRAALRHLLRVLRDPGVVVKQATDAVAEELDHFDAYMEHERGLATNTRAQRLRIIRAFLQQNADPDPVELLPVTAGHLREFMEETLRRWSSASAQVLTGTLRSYLRFRANCGDEVDHLLPVVASPASWRLAALPETLSPEEIDQLLEPFPPDLPSARRAYAMVRCVVDLGLRASEVVGLDLDDVDWHSGTIRIGPNKSRRIDILPLPEATGSAIAEYLRSERPPTTNRRVFVRHVAPVNEPIGPGVVRRAVRAAYRRLGLSHTRVHVLRHTLAGRLLEGGSTLKEVADVLRHRALDTTLIYAKIDLTRLTSVAMPWPGDVS